VRCARDRREQLELINSFFLQKSYDERQAADLEQRKSLAIQEKRERKKFRVVLTVTLVALGLFVLYERSNTKRGTMKRPRRLS